MSAVVVVTTRPGAPSPKTATPLPHVIINQLLIQDFSECYLPSDKSNTILNNPQKKCRNYVRLGTLLTDGGGLGWRTSRTISGSIPGCVTGFFSDIFPSDRTMALGSTQPVLKMSTRNISWGLRRPVREADKLTTFMCRTSWKSGSLNLLEPSGPHRACYGNPLPLPNRWDPPAPLVLLRPHCATVSGIRHTWSNLLSTLDIYVCRTSLIPPTGYCI